MICGKPTQNGGVCGNVAGHCRWHDKQQEADWSQIITCSDRTCGRCQGCIANGVRPPDESQQPPRDARKAEDWEREDASLVWQTPRCRECNNPMWTREPAKHDLCEECGWLIRDSMQQLATQQRQERSDRIINPFDGSVFAGQTGSLPTQKG